MESPSLLSLGVHPAGGLRGLKPADLLNRAILGLETPPANPSETLSARRDIPTRGRFIFSLALFSALGAVLWIGRSFAPHMPSARKSSSGISPPSASAPSPVPADAVGLEPNPAADGLVALPNGELPTETRRKQLETRALKGDVVAEYQLGLIYRRGEGVLRDDATAVMWFRKAVEAGYMPALRPLEMEYGDGRMGIEPYDWDNVVKWYEKAAKEGDRVMQRALAECYRTGRGVPQNLNTAIYWYQKAVDQREPIAELALAKLYRFGRGVPKNERMAFDLTQRSATRGYENAMVDLAQMYLDGTGTAPDIAKEYNWYEKAAVHGNQEAEVAVGRMYLYGKIVPRNVPLAVAWFHRAGHMGNAMAQFFLDHILAGDDRVEKDDATTLELIRQAAESGDATAQLCLAGVYDASHDYDAYRTAFAWYLKAANNGNPVAQNTVAWWYHIGKGNHGDDTEALKWYLKAAENGNPEAETALGDIYTTGVIVQKDLAKARQWRIKAALAKSSLPDVPLVDVQQPVFLNDGSNN
jgi:TPR repeat protein